MQLHSDITSNRSYSDAGAAPHCNEGGGDPECTCLEFCARHHFLPLLLLLVPAPLDFFDLLETLTTLPEVTPKLPAELLPLPFFGVLNVVAALRSPAPRALLRWSML